MDTDLFFPLIEPGGSGATTRSEEARCNDEFWVLRFVGVRPLPRVGVFRRCMGVTTGTSFLSFSVLDADENELRSLAFRRGRIPGFADSCFGVVGACASGSGMVLFPRRDRVGVFVLELSSVFASISFRRLLGVLGGADSREDRLVLL